MRKLILLACLCAVLAPPAWAARGADPEPEAGYLSIERGRGTVVLDVRGSVLGRFTNGTITVTDKTPNDLYAATITGRRLLVQRRISPTKMFVRGLGVRFRMLGGSYRIVIRGQGISLSAVGRGSVSIDGEPRFIADDLGVYSVESDVDCSIEPLACTPVPDEPVRLKLGKGGPETPPGQKENAG
jgi:hypothetical protein